MQEKDFYLPQDLDDLDEDQGNLLTSKIAKQCYEKQKLDKNYPSFQDLKKAIQELGIEKAALLIDNAAIVCYSSRSEKKLGFPSFQELKIAFRNLDIQKIQLLFTNNAYRCYYNYQKNGQGFPSFQALAEAVEDLNIEKAKLLFTGHVYGGYYNRVVGHLEFPSLQELRFAFYELNLDKSTCLIHPNTYKFYMERSQGNLAFPSFRDLKAVLQDLELEQAIILLTPQASSCYTNRSNGNQAFPSFQELKISLKEIGIEKTRMLISPITSTHYHNKMHYPDSYLSFAELKKLTQLNPKLAELVLTKSNQSIKRTIAEFCQDRFIGCFYQQEGEFSFDSGNDLFNGIDSLGLSDETKVKLTELSKCVINSFNIYKKQGDKNSFQLYLDDMPDEDLGIALIGIFIECTNTILRKLQLTEISKNLGSYTKQAKEGEVYGFYR